MYFLVALRKTTVELSGQSGFSTTLEGAVIFARYTVNFTPTLAFLLIAARIRALQIDPKYGTHVHRLRSRADSLGDDNAFMRRM